MKHSQPKESDHATPPRTCRTRRSRRPPGGKDGRRGKGRLAGPLARGEDRCRRGSCHPRSWPATHLTRDDRAVPRLRRQADRRGPSRARRLRQRRARRAPPAGRAAEATVVGRALRTPRAAALAGIAFAVIFTVALVLVRRAVPADPGDAGRWLSDDSRRGGVLFALGLVPFAGIAFLWFVGVLRDRVGEAEDRFFATVFLGSALLFLGMLFVASALAAGLVASAGDGGRQPPVLRHLGGRAAHDLRARERLRDADGRRVHDRHLDDPAAHEARASMARRRRVRGRDRAPAGGRLLRLGRAGVPGVGAGAERVRPRRRGRATDAQHDGR